MSTNAVFNILVLRALGQMFQNSGKPASGRSLTLLADLAEAGHNVDEHMKTVAEELNKGLANNWSRTLSNIESDSRRLMETPPLREKPPTQEELLNLKGEELAREVNRPQDQTAKNTFGVDSGKGLTQTILEQGKLPEVSSLGAGLQTDHEREIATGNPSQKVLENVALADRSSTPTDPKSQPAIPSPTTPKDGTIPLVGKGGQGDPQATQREPTAAEKAAKEAAEKAASGKVTPATTGEEGKATTPVSTQPQIPQNTPSVPAPPQQKPVIPEGNKGK